MTIVSGFPPTLLAVEPSDVFPPIEREGECFHVARLNEGLPATDSPPDLETPRSMLASFLDLCEAGDYRRAAHCLNLNAFEPARQAKIGPLLAEKLKFLLHQKVWIRWDEYPDRPDGHVEAPPAGEKEEPKGPERAFKLGSVTLGDREEDLRIERVKTPTGPAVWVFSRQTVALIDPLYRAYGPRPWEKRIPAFLSERHLGKLSLWLWAGLVVVLGLAGLVGWAVQKVAVAGFRRLGFGWSTHLAEGLHGPLMWLIGVSLFAYLIGHYLRLAVPVLAIVDPVLTALVIGCATWLSMRLTGAGTAWVSRRYERVGDASANAVITRTAVLRYLLTSAIFAVGAIFAFRQFDWFRQLASTLLASAGLIGVVVGIAAHRSLGNLLAGLQLAITQPVSSGDAVLIGDDFGWIEEIGFTYVVIRTWDQRRLVVPIGHLIDNPVSNWSKRNEKIINRVFLHADYRVDVDALRDEFKETLERSDDWDRETPPILQVTDCKEGTIELRALCGASNPTAAWNLQCLVRERLISYLQTLEGGRYLPRSRVVLAEDHADGNAFQSERAASSDGSR